MTGDIELRREGPLLWVTLARPDCGNALSWAMLDALAALFFLPRLIGRRPRRRSLRHATMRRIVPAGHAS